MSTFGRKGGAGPSVGKRRIDYWAIGPDGGLYRKATYRIAENPVMCFYKHKGEWFVACVTSLQDAQMRMPLYIAIEATAGKRP